MPELVSFNRSGDIIEAKQIAQGQKAFDGLQKATGTGGASVRFSSGSLSVAFDPQQLGSNAGIIVQVQDYDSALDRYSMSEANLSGSATGEGIAPYIEPRADKQFFDNQFVLIEATGNVSVPIGATVVAYPLNTEENGERLYIFAYGAAVLYCKVTSADWATPIEGNPCNAAGGDVNTAVTVTMNEPYRSTALLIRDVKQDDVVPVLINTPYSGGGPFTITGDILYQETTVDVENADDLDAAVDAWDCGATPSGFTETLVSDIYFDDTDGSFHKKTRLQTVNEFGKIVHVAEEADEVWAYFDQGTGDSEIYSAGAPAP